MRLNRNRRWLTTIAALGGALLLTAGVAGCAPGGGGGSDEPSGDADGAVTIQWWDYFAPGASENALMSLLDEYQDANPKVKIERQFIAYADLKKRLLQSAGATSLPDVVVINSPDHQQFAELGIAANLDDELAEWGELDKY